MKAIGYARVSTDKQAEQGVSLEAQEAKIRAIATVQGAELLEVVVDGGESAKNLNRPLLRLIALVDDGAASGNGILRGPSPKHSASVMFLP